MFTFLFASLLLWLIERAENNARLLLCVPPLFVLWLNLHAGFAIGPVLMFLYAAGLILETATGTSPWAEVRPIVSRILLAALACLALVPLNPNGVRLYLYPLETVRSVELRSLIVEWFSPDFHLSMYFPFLLVLLLVLVACGWSQVPLRGRTFLPLAFMLLSALDAVRHIPIFMLLAAPVIAQALPFSSQAWRVLPARRPARTFRPHLNCAVLIFLAAFALWRWTTLGHNQSAHEAATFPRGAVAYLRENSQAQPLRLFAYYDWGGYAIWNLYPQYRVFVDGRSDLYGDEFLKKFQTVVQLRKGWRTILDNRRVEIVFIPPASGLAQGLLLDSDWSAAYRDSQAVVFVRNRPSGQALLPALSPKPQQSEKILSRTVSNLRN